MTIRKVSPKVAALERLIFCGDRMSNVIYNLAQGRDSALAPFKGSQVEWDKARLAYRELTEKEVPHGER